MEINYYRLESPIYYARNTEMTVTSFAHKYGPVCYEVNLYNYLLSSSTSLLLI